MSSSMRQFNKEPVWRPNEHSGKTMKTFMEIVAKKYNLKFTDYWDFHKWTVENISEFWEEIWDFCGIIYSKPYDKVVDLSIPMDESPKWFEGARLNIAENLLKCRDDRTAFILTGEDREVERISYKQVYEQTRVYASALRNIGLQKGDRVACYMSNRLEAIIAMLATTSIGAIWVGCLATLGPQANLDRLVKLQPKAFFTVDQFTHMQKACDLLKNIKYIANGLSSLEKVIIVPSKLESKSKDISDIKNSCFLDEFLLTAPDSEGAISEIVFEQVSFSHPVFINFTSGTSGPPKTLVHGFGSLLSHFREFVLQSDHHKSDVILNPVPVGWIAWASSPLTLYFGRATVLFEGIPFFLSPTYMWDIVDNLKITVLCMVPSYLDEMETRNYIPTEKHSLSSLKDVYISGSVVKRNNYDFCRKIKEDLRIKALFGCTEVMTFCLVCTDILPTYLEENQVPSLGLHVECLDNEGNSVVGEMGELAISKPTPSMALGFWEDPTGDLFKKSYFSKYPGKFLIGDVIIINPITKGIVVCGRSEETITQRGFRFGAIEIYNVVKMFPEVRDSLCVAQCIKDGNERAVLFLLMKDDQPLKESLIQKLEKRISKELSSQYVPDIIMKTPGIPYNINGKKSEILVKKIINKVAHNPETIANPECLKFYYDIPELQNF